MDAVVPEAGSPAGSRALSVTLPGGLVEGVMAPAYVVDGEGLIIAVNAAAESLLGRSGPDLLGHDAHDLLHRDSHGRTLDRSRCEMRAALLGHRTGHSELGWFTRGDGSLLGLSWFLTPTTSAREASEPS